MSTFEKSMMSCPNRWLLAKNWGILQNQILSIFKFRNECYKQLEGIKYMKKMGSFAQFPCFVPEFWSLNYLKKCIFCNFVLISVRNISLIKQFTYIHLKGLVTNFQKMVLFIILWFTVSEILGFKVEKFC